MPGIAQDFQTRSLSVCSMKALSKQAIPLVDLGTGTGTLARGFAQRGCNVIGLDISAQLLEQAKGSK